MQLRRNPSQARRRGIVLLIVLAMLTLFAIAGLTFVLYADAASESARINRGAESIAAGGLPDMDPNAAFNLFLGQLIYGVPDDANGATSSLRGHSLAETMYGSYDSQGAVPSDVPYDGTGRLHYAYPAGTPAVAGQDEYGMVNYMYFQADGFVHDPGRYGYRTSPAAARTAPYVGGQNAPYTYPDVNSMFVATINPATGQITNRSYDRGGSGHYQSLRPQIGDMGPGFPPFQAPGDVQNLPGMPGSAPVPDSIWIDIGAPELTTANGIRYKMLVAPLILDLDSRINLNVAGNVLATTYTAPNNNAHVSNQGLGPWEVNMSKVLNAELFPPPHTPAIPPAPATEWQNLILGNPPTGAAVLPYGRYGANRLPTSTFALAGPAPHVYAQCDLDSLINQGASAYSVTGSGGTGPYALPGLGQGFFPSFDPNAYLNGQMPEHTNAAGALNHPMYYNPLLPSAGNRAFLLDAYAPFLWAGVNASPNADLHVLCPTNFLALDPTLGTTRRIHESTVYSWDLDRPGASPYTWDSSPASATPYTLQTGALYPTAPANTFPAAVGPPPAAPPPPPAPPVPPGSDFNAATFRSTLPTQWPALQRLDLNRPLAAYPASGVQPPDRQQFAMDIFNRLLAVTGMTATYNSLNPSSANPPNAQQYAALRWLAQLSANIVDYIDTDDVMTSFQWAGAPAAPQTPPQAPDTGYVFGTELPKLVVNEVYLEYDNDSSDPAGMAPNPSPPPAMVPSATQQYHMNVWAELLNPLPTTAELAPNPANNANLVNANGNPVYQLVITSPNQDLRKAANLVGDPDGATPGGPPFATQQAPTGAYTATGAYSSTAATGGQVLAVVNNWGGVQNVTPVGTTQNIPPAANANQGFLVIGPPNPPLAQGQAANTQTQIQTSVTANNMTYTVANNDPQADNPPANPLAPPTILLQRLANPNLPWNGIPGAGYNPYVTVDYVEMDKVKTKTGQQVINDARQYNHAGPNASWVSNPNSRTSFGRNQPYAAAAAGGTTTWQKQTFVTPPSPPNQQPATSFFAVNNPATAPSWLVHLDRPLISPAELLQVSGFKPQELTQQFVDSTGAKFMQRAPWADQNSRIYRLLEFIKASNANAATFQAPAGRVPGKVNINTLDPNAKEVFEALADAEPGNSFYNSSGMGSTDSNVDAAFTNLMTARANNGPFWGLGEGPYANTSGQFANAGINNTVLPSLANTGTSAHPYQQSEMLTKLFSNLTTRSNVFAVWLTVGFFQVTNDQVQPMKLGAEINAAQHKNIRHNMFAIVDRTQVQTFSTSTVAGTNIAPGNASISIPNPVPDTTRTGRSWTVQPGSVLVYEPNTANEETVVVGAGNMAIFTRAHSGVVPVVSRGNPGPWIRYDASLDTGANGVVPYFKIID